MVKLALICIAVFFVTLQSCEGHSSSSSSHPNRNIIRFPDFAAPHRHAKQHKFPANEPERLLAQLAKSVMEAITTNNKYMDQPGANASNAEKINSELLNLFTTIEGYVQSNN